MKATAKDLRFHSKELLDCVDRGEEVIITYRGKPHAKLIPFKTNNNEIKETKLFGIWKDRENIDVKQHVRELRKGRF